MFTCRVQLQGDPVALVLYQEQGLTTKLNRPYRQRFLQLVPGPQLGTVDSLSFRPREPQRWIGFCSKPSSQRQVPTTALGAKVCTVTLRRQGQGFVGETPPEGCPANVRGAVRVTNRVELSSQGMQTWDRGFDAAGKQVWGAKDESYRFRRVSQP
jgi:hypothetical protein